MFELPLGQGQVNWTSRRDFELTSYGTRLGLAIPTLIEGTLFAGPYPATRYTRMRAIELETSSL